LKQRVVEKGKEERVGVGEGLRRRRRTRRDKTMEEH